MVDQALDASREGGLPARVWRYATGDEVDESIEPTVTYDKGAIDEFVAIIAEDVNREPVDAGIDAGTVRLSVSAGETGRRRSAPTSCAAGREGGPEPRRARTLAAQVDEVEPDVTTDELAAAVPDLPDRRPLELPAARCTRT